MVNALCAKWLMGAARRCSGVEKKGSGASKRVCASSAALRAKRQIRASAEDSALMLKKEWIVISD